MAYLADPGGVFESDTHRRVLGHLTHDAMDPEALLARMAPDVGTELVDEDELGEVLKDLEADGHASQSKAGWKQTKRGSEALNQ